MANGTNGGLSGQTAQVNHFGQLHELEKTSFADVAGYFAFYGIGDASLVRNGDAIRLSSVPVTQNFFSMLGVKPELGRSFTALESAADPTNVVMLSHAIWRSEFNLRPRDRGQEHHPQQHAADCRRRAHRPASTSGRSSPRHRAAARASVGETESTRLTRRRRRALRRLELRLERRAARNEQRVHRGLGRLVGGRREEVDEALPVVLRGVELFQPIPVCP